MTASGFSRQALSAAIATAGAVLRPTGSRMTAACLPIARNCSAIRKRCSALAMTIGAPNKDASSTRATVCCRSVESSISDSNCLGRASRDSGQRRDPVPPDSNTGTTEASDVIRCIPSVLCTRCALSACARTVSLSSASGEEFPANGANDDRHVQLQRAVLDVVEVVVDARDRAIAMLGAAAAAAHLRQPGDAGLHRMPLKVVGNEIFIEHSRRQHARNMRAWTDQRHFALEHVDQLRDFIEAGAAQNTP